MPLSPELRAGLRTGYCGLEARMGSSAVAWATIVTAFVAALILSRRLPARRSAARLAIFCVLWLALLVVPLMLLGVFQMLGWVRTVTFLPAAILVAALAAACSLAVKSRPIDAPAGGAWATFRRAILPVRLPAALLAVVYLLLSGPVWLGYPEGIDALDYHLPLSTHWAQSGDLSLNVTAPWEYSQPSNVELAATPFLGTRWASLGIAPSLIGALLLVCASILLIRRLGGSATTAAIASLLVLNIPMIQHQTFSGWVDLPGIACLFTAVALFLERRSTAVGAPDGRVLFASGLALGLCMGTKLVLLPFAVLVAAAGAVALAAEARWRPRRLLRPVLAATLGILLTGSFWYVRALARTGNPVYPVQAQIASLRLPGFPMDTVARGVYEDRWVHSKAAWLIYPWSEWVLYPGYLNAQFYNASNGLGGAFAAFALIALAWGFVRARRRRAWFIALSLWFGGLLLWWFTLRRLPRYGLPVWALLCILAAPSAALIRRYRPAILNVLLAVLVMLTGFASSFQPLYDTARALRSRDFSRSSFYQYPPFLDRLPPGKCVVNNTTLLNFLLQGNHLQNVVVPNLRIPEPLTAGFLQSSAADYLLTEAPANSERTSPFPGWTFTAEDARPGSTAVYRLWARPSVP